MDLITVGLQQGGEQVCADIGVVNGAVQVHLGSQGGGLCVIRHLDGVNMHIVDVPVSSVFGHDPLYLGLEGGQDEGAAEEQSLGAGAKAVAALSQKLAVDRHVSGPAQHGQEVGAGGIQGVDQSIGVSGLHPDVVRGNLRHLFDHVAVLVQLDRVAVVVGAVGSGFQRQLVGGVLVVGRGVGHLGYFEVILAARVILGVQNIVGGIYPVLGGDFGHLVAILIHPLDPLTDMEGPFGVIIVVLPALGKGRLDHSIAIVLNEGIHHVGRDLQIVGRSSGEIVHGLYLGGVEGAVDGRAIIAGIGVAAGSQGQGHRQGQQQGERAFHFHGIHSFLNQVLRRRRAGAVPHIL